MLETIVFSIDKGSDVHTQAKFLRYIDTLRAMGYLRGKFASCIGSYDGVVERSYMMLAVDFNKHVRNEGFVDGQESILRVPGDVRQPCILEFIDGSDPVSLEPMKQVSASCVHMYPAWTYVEETGHYFVC